MNRRPRLLIADHQSLVAECLQRLLENEFPRVEIVMDGRALLDAAANSKPDLVLLEITMPPFDGFDLIHRLREVSHGTRVIILTWREDAECAREALRAGASGYVLKRCGVSELQRAIHTVLDGHCYLTPLLSRRRAAAAINLNSAPSGIILTSRQREVLHLVAQGRTAKEIASTLALSVKTAVYHKVAIMDKLGLRTTAELTRYALEHGILAFAGKIETQPAPAPVLITPSETAPVC